VQSLEKRRRAGTCLLNDPEPQKGRNTLEAFRNPEKRRKPRLLGLVFAGKVMTREVEHREAPIKPKTQGWKSRADLEGPGSALPPRAEKRWGGHLEVEKKGTDRGCLRAS